MRLKRYFLVASMVFLAACHPTKKLNNDLASNNPIVSRIDISGVQNDRLPVSIDPGRFTSETVTYRLPRVIQGTYSVSDFGKYVADFKAFDYKGNPLPVSHPDANTWTISNAKALDKITYWVNDTYDIEKEGGIGKATPFSPAGTDIEPNEYVLNLHGFVGYFDRLKNNAYKLDVIAPTQLKETSALQKVATQMSADKKTVTRTYHANRYFDITDNPMMYGDLDIETFQVGNIKIVLSVYSPNKKHSAASLKPSVYKMMQAQKAYLGDINTTPRYDIYLYLSENKSDSPKGFGALEHNTSTVVVLPEAMPQEALEETMTDVVSHEFFHIVSPLSVHSEDVHYFDYNKPTFSKHLWMYEGVTEYFANLFQVNQGLIPPQTFYDKMMGKINRSKQMNDTMSFTTMSSHILEAPYKDQYLNVYQKGALIGMCIDILLREESHGQRGILSLMKALSKKYGQNKPFKDDALINEIVSMTYPSLRAFFDAHVIGHTPIDYSQYLAKVGLKIGESKVKTNYIMMEGVPIVKGDPATQTLAFTDAVLKNSFWKSQGAQPGDVIKSIGGTALTFDNANQLLQQVFSWQEGQAIDVELERSGQIIPIKTTTTQPYTTGRTIVENPEATEAQKALRKAWLKS